MNCCRPSLYRFLCACLVSVVILLASVSGYASLEEDVARKNQELAAQKKQIQALTAKERTLHTDLAASEKAVAQATARLKELEAELEVAKKAQVAIDGRLTTLHAQQASAQSTLAEHVRILWPIYLLARSEGFSSAQQWAEANRKAVWLAALYREAHVLREEIERQAQLVAVEQAAQETARTALAAQLQKISDSQADVLKKQSRFAAQLKEVRAQRTRGEKSINDLIASIASLQHQIAKQAEGKIATQQGRLPWPAKGKLIASFAPDGATPSTGIGMALSENTPVRCVSGGKVVHNDQLRGFGQVVIVFHGDDYYSLYAFLAEAPLSVGQTVKQGEQLGICGFYPKAQGSGLYFELRFRQKAINPLKWLQPG